GVIGMELGQALSRLGVRTRTFGVGGAVGPFQSDKLRQLADETFNRELYLDPDATIEQVEQQGDGVAITFYERESSQK
ncbi:dihydrolipoyl dehydrogenase, partial [Pantoea sp. SIMBA_133]